MRLLIEVCPARVGFKPFLVAEDECVMVCVMVHQCAVCRHQPMGRFISVYGPMQFLSRPATGRMIASSAIASLSSMFFVRCCCLSLSFSGLWS
mmetsp:Transcript_5448/g.15012  ORF Transcript_5448/g.15012 Transcript_5448/m.15012 type:complete len:93 (+) Transcript_5448:484-762(+)